ncbi:MAG: LolA-like protein, partial [Pirellulaceae bacterium]
MEVYAAYPDKFRATVDTQLGKLERGSDGKTVWISFPNADPTILEGADRVSAIRESAQDRFGNWRKVYLKADYVGDEDVEGTKCAKVVLTLKPIDPQVQELPVTAYVAQDTNLIVKWTTEMATPRGNIEVAVGLSDYKKVGDVLIPHLMTVATQGLEQSVKVSEIVFNKAIPAEIFALPEAVKAQLEHKKSQPEKKPLETKKVPPAKK